MLIDATDLAAAVPGYPGYWVSQAGEVWSTKRRDPRALVSRAHPHQGYLRVDLKHPSTGRRNHTIRVARLVASAWLGTPPDDRMVCHRDGVNTNDHMSNLYYGTASDNMLDRHWHEKGNRGTPRPQVDPNDSASYADHDTPIGLFEAGYDPALGF